jgi:lactate dehydrogenase-like 2-hydroxyacid dehydrogenase
MIVKYPNKYKPKVLLTGRINHDLLDEFKDAAEFHLWEDAEEVLLPSQFLHSIIHDYDGIINFADVKADEDLLQKAKKLKIIANASVGFDNLDIELLTEYKIWATNVPGIFSYPVAEYVIACLLMLLRRLNEADEFVRNDKWKKFEPGRWDGISLKEKTLGILGLGAIGIELRKIALSLGVKTYYFDPVNMEEDGWLPFDELLSTSDILSIHIPLNAKTFKLVNKTMIDSMKDGAILVNAARGTVIDEKALKEALKTGKLGGAILDVFDDEPNVPDVFKKMSNVILTPHIAGGTKSTREASLKQALKNVTEVLKGRAPINALNNLK